MAQSGQARGPQKLNGQVIVGELLRNMELGAFEMAYTTLLPCVFNVYLHPEDHTRLAGVFGLIVEDAKRALAARVAELNASPGSLSFRRKPRKEHRIAARDWIIQFYSDSEEAVPPGDIEIHSELSEAPQPGFQGVRTTLIDREPSVTAVHAVTRAPAPERIYGEIRYEDDSGSQVYLITQNEVRIGRGGDEEPMDLALYTNDEVSREHALLRRDAATGRFFLVDKSTNGTWLNGRRLRRDLEQDVPDRAEIGVADVLTLTVQVRR